MIIEVTGRQNFIGTPETVAATIDEYVQDDASDGFILVPHITPDGLDEFADKVVPILQERGVFRTDYEGSTLREHLGLLGHRRVEARLLTGARAAIMTNVDIPAVDTGPDSRRADAGQPCVGVADRAASPVRRAARRRRALPARGRTVCGTGRPCTDPRAWADAARLVGPGGSFAIAGPIGQPPPGWTSASLGDRRAARRRSARQGTRPEAVRLRSPTSRRCWTWWPAPNLARSGRGLSNWAPTWVYGTAAARVRWPASGCIRTAGPRSARSAPIPPTVVAVSPADWCRLWVPRSPSAATGC